MSRCDKPLITPCVLEHDHDGYCSGIEQLALDAYHVLEERINTLFDKIKHGDQEHQDWLKKAIDEHFDL